MCRPPRPNTVPAIAGQPTDELEPLADSSALELPVDAPSDPDLAASETAAAPVGGLSATLSGVLIARSAADATSWSISGSVIVSSSSAYGASVYAKGPKGIVV